MQRKSARGLMIAMLVPVWAGGCSLWPATERQEINVAAEIPAPVPSDDPGFHNSDPAINTALAKRVCADGYQVDNDQKEPASFSQFEVTQLHCVNHTWDLFD